ncbi:MAG: metal ABC transporter permease [Rhodothermales bacterium]
MLDFLSDYTFRTVAMGSALLGLVSGALGTFAVLRRQSLLGDAISHAALPGIAIGFLLTGAKIPAVMIAGALIAGLLATLFVLAVTQTTRIPYDSALGIVLSVFFGLGLVLLTVIQQMPNAQQAGLSAFLFGQAAALVEEDLIVMGVLGLAALGLLLLFWRPFKLLAFDPEFGRSLGLPMRGFDILLTSLLVVAIVIGLQTVGVVLMSAMVIAPAAAARQWTDRLGIMVTLAAVFGAAAGLVGAFISSTGARVPTGPTIVVCMGSVMALSLFFAPKRGLTWRWWRGRQNARRLNLDAVLLDLYALAVQHERKSHPHDESVLNVMNELSANTRDSLHRLADRGWARRVDALRWSLTPEGVAQAQRALARLSATPDDEGPTV